MSDARGGGDNWNGKGKKKGRVNHRALPDCVICLRKNRTIMRELQRTKQKLINSRDDLRCLMQLEQNSQFSDAFQNLIRRGIRMWEESTCLRFRENMMVYFAHFASGTGQRFTEYSVSKKKRNFNPFSEKFRMHFWSWKIWMSNWFLLQNGQFL